MKKSLLYGQTLWLFLKQEITRAYHLENDKARFTDRRQNIYSFMKIPREVEKFMAYGFFQCADSFMHVFTFLPLRLLLAIWEILVRSILRCFGYLNAQTIILTSAEICDLLKGSMIFVCAYLMFFIDTNMMYHLIKSQSVIKLYIFYNMLEVGDRLFSAFGQDTIDALFWTAAEPRGRKRDHIGVIPHLVFATIYVFLHSLLVLFQATTMNVAINASNKSLLTIMMSNNFVELKGSVFKKFDKKNLFQVACSDVRERFHLFVLLSIVVLQTMREFNWREERFWIMLPDCLIVLGAEVMVDWIKHAFITRFNKISVNAYNDYRTSLAYDTAQTRRETAFSDHSDFVAHRMGFIPLPLGVVMIRVVLNAINIEGARSFFLLFIAYVVLITFRILSSLVILGKGSILMKSHNTKLCGRQDLTHDKPKIQSETQKMYEKSNSFVRYMHIDATDRKRDFQNNSAVLLRNTLPDESEQELRVTLGEQQSLVMNTLAAYRIDLVHLKEEIITLNDKITVLTSPKLNQH